MTMLDKYKKNITSQWGEDGIIRELFYRIGSGNRLCVEFGAWDGKHYSNTWRLWHNEGWSAVLIEGDSERAAQLARDTAAFQKVITHEAFIQNRGEQSLDAVLDALIPGKQIDLLCIDVDGDDYYIFQSIKKYLPRVLVIEYNPTIPPHEHIVQYEGEYFGASAKAIAQLAEQKGYRLVSMTETNCFFVRKEEWTRVGIEPTTVDELFPKHMLTYVISSYGGIPFLTRKTPYVNMDRRIAGKALPRFYADSPLVPVVIQQNEYVLKRYVRKFKANVRMCGKILFEKTVVRRIYINHMNKKRNSQNTIRHQQKQEAIRDYAKKYNLLTLVETGTYMGDMVHAMQETFDYIHSVELSQELYKKACERFSAQPNIHLYQGDSATELPTILETLSAAALFWLDGHYSGGITAKASHETPVKEELESILSHTCKKHVILIDDARCFTGEHDYPTISEIRNLVGNSGLYTMIVADDIIRIIPR